MTTLTSRKAWITGKGIRRSYAAPCKYRCEATIYIVSGESSRCMRRKSGDTSYCFQHQTMGCAP